MTEYPARRGNGKGSITARMKKLLIAVSILFVVLCFLINGSIQQVLLENANESMTITAQKLENQLDFMYDKMETFSMGIAGEEEVQTLMVMDFPYKTRAIGAVEEMIAYYKILDPSIVDISFVNDEVHYSTVYPYEELDELRTLGREGFSWLGARKRGFYNAEENTTMLLYARKILHQGEDVGTLIISIDVSYFQVSETEEMNSYYMLADEEAILYSFNGPEEVSRQIWQEWKAGEENKAGGKSWYIRSVYSADMGCYQISALDVGQVNQSLGRTNRLIWSCVVLVLVFMLVMFWMIHGQVVRPLRDFNGVIRRIRSLQKRSLQEELNLGGCQEIREIGDEFTGMMRDIEQLNRKIFDTATDLYEMKVQKQEAELSYMRSQIDPHFLYNTLEAFRKMALMKNAPEMAQMAVDMGNIFRYSTKGSYIVPLSEEIAIIKSYVRIQKTRFRGRMEVFYFLPKEVLQIPVMKMLLQPVVENAVCHGLEPKENGGNLFIGARVEQGTLLITVKDDGAGIPAERLAEMQAELSSKSFDTSRHVGILNTHARIRLQYGEGFGVRLESAEGDGTTVTIAVPAERTKKQDEGHSTESLQDGRTGEKDVSCVDCGR